MAVERLSDAVFARAIKGVATPVFYKGEQVGERVRYDEKLAMFLLRYRDPARYGAWTNRWRAEHTPHAAAADLAAAADDIAAVDDLGHEAADDDRSDVDRNGPPTAADRRYVAVHERDVADARRAAAKPMPNWRATREETDTAILALLAKTRSRADPAPNGSCGSSTLDPIDVDAFEEVDGAADVDGVEDVDGVARAP